MAHIRSQKKLLSADLKDLISHVTGFEVFLFFSFKVYIQNISNFRIVLNW